MSGRDITPAAAAALQASHVSLCVLVALQFADETLRFSNTASPISWGGYTWLGAANFTQLETVEETTEPRAAALKLRFSGLNADHLSKVLDEHYAGRPAQIWIAPLDALDRPIVDPIEVFRGRMDQPQVTVGGPTFDIDIALENRWADWDRPRSQRNNDADHQSRHPGDKFFEYAAAMEAAEFVWGLIKGPAAPDVRSMTKTLMSSGGNLLYALNKPLIQPVQNFFRRLF